VKATFLLFICLLAGYVGNVPVALAQTPDSTRQLPIVQPTADTLPARWTTPADSAADDMAVLVDSVVTASDTVRVSAAAQAELYKIVPKKATIRSALLPGWGQVYNRQYWKVPLVAAGLITFGIIITRFTANYNKFYNAYESAYPRDSTGKAVQLTGNQSRTITAVVDERQLTLDQLNQRASFWRRWRDYNIIFTALFWGLNVVDANVSAHLKTFDISDSLTLKYEPMLLPSTVGYVPGLRLTMNFKK
jgi:hypothetical protein